MQFSQNFRQNKNENANSNIHTKLQAYILSNISVIGKTRIMEFHQPPPPPLPKTLTTPLPIGYPQILINFRKKMRYRVSINYI